MFNMRWGKLYMTQVNGCELFFAKSNRKVIEILSVYRAGKCDHKLYDDGRSSCGRETSLAHWPMNVVSRHLWIISKDLQTRKFNIFARITRCIITTHLFPCRSERCLWSWWPTIFTWLTIKYDKWKM